MESSIAHCEDEIKRVEKSIADYDTDPFYANMVRDYIALGSIL